MLCTQAMLHWLYGDQDFNPQSMPLTQDMASAVIKEPLLRGHVL